jgi:hypothetical protein
VLEGREGDGYYIVNAADYGESFLQILREWEYKSGVINIGKNQYT